MASGLIALLDDVAAIAKVAAASLDDVAAAAGKAGAKAAGVVIDDAAVTPRYVTGFDAARELPIVWRIALGSLRNKLLVLLPAALLLAAFAPFLITPLLVLGGLYLCFEGTEKVAEWLFPHPPTHAEAVEAGTDPARLEEERVAGAIKTDFILSAEIMAITLAIITEGGFWMRAAVLAVVAVAITVAVYGAVALIVKADDAGVAMAARGRLGVTRAAGRALVRGMPHLLKALSVVGTAAMVWVGGGILLHALEEFGLGALPHLFHGWAHAAGAAFGGGAVEWLVNAALAGVVGLAAGALLLPVGRRLLH
jgi:predicted DNA repair protein MutK